MGSEEPIIFYDIASGPPVTCFAPNPWKTRYALNFKRAPYRTEWVELPDVTSVRKRLGAAPNRTHMDGSAFYTLPIIEDTARGAVVGDSFEIAVHLDQHYPTTPLLFPPGTIGLQRAFNLHVDATVSRFAALCAQGMPLNPATADATRAMFAARFGVPSFESLTPQGVERARQIQEFKGAMEELAKAYSHGEGPFLVGGAASYADLIVGAWLQFLKATLPEAEWADFLTWQGGLWRRIHEALQQYAEVK